MTTTSQRRAATTAVPAQVVTHGKGTRRSARLFAGTLLVLALLSGGLSGLTRGAAAADPQAGLTLPAYEFPTDISTSPEFRWDFAQYAAR